MIDKLKFCFGLPAVVLADNGPPFNSENFRQFLLRNNITYLNSLLCNTTANDLAKREVQTIKNNY